MPRLTSAELQEAKRKKHEEERLAKEQEEARLLEMELQRQEWRERDGKLYERYTQLNSYVTGIYEESNKLSTKWPTHHVTQTMVDRANRAITDTRELLKLESEDEPDGYLDEIQLLVPAGDAIEAQDVTLTLRTVKDALDRMRRRHGRRWSDFSMLEF